VVETRLLEVDRLTKVFDAGTGWRQARVSAMPAVDGLSFTVDRGGSLAIVGESGSGKTTIARMLVGLERPTSGWIAIASERVAPNPSPKARRIRARQVQIVFQNPYVSLDPRQTAAEAVAEVLGFHLRLTGNELAVRSQALLNSVGLGAKEHRSRPRQLSGGQCQRVAIARALAAEPQLLVLDEATSGLDVSVQAQILNLLADLRSRTGIAYIFISHDLAVIRQVCDDLVVMYRGRAVEEGRVDQILARPAHPYTQKLVASVPGSGPIGDPAPAAGLDAATGCRYRGRCPFAWDRCSDEPELIELEGAHAARCWLVEGFRGIDAADLPPATVPRP
jgi:peptide/nickel transport system ATP-binding protein